MLIRFGSTSDIPQLHTLVGNVGLFEPGDELEGFKSMISDHLAEGKTQEEQEGHRWAVCFDGDDDDKEGNNQKLLGGAYYTPESFAYGVTNLLFIACLPETRGKGYGSSLLQFVENDCKERGIRMLIVDTSGTDDFKQTRNFYKKNDYEQEGTIRDYYTFGDDKVTFRKLLTSPP